VNVLLYRQSLLARYYAFFTEADLCDWSNRNEVFVLVYQNVYGNGMVVGFEFPNGQQSDGGIDASCARFGKHLLYVYGLVALLLTGCMTA